MKPIVKFSNVSKTYSLFRKKSDQLFDIFSFNKNSKQFSALSNISFEVFKGETVGIIGINGSGKSTLSNILAQIIPPTSGQIEIDGETSLVAISAGLNNHLTGLENIELKCLMHGIKKGEIDQITPSIIDFADIGDFISQPIKSYSSGMKSRLGFAISVHIEPDILVIDEALSVGDSTFYQKCLDKFDEFKSQGKTIFFISHSLSQVKSISDRIMWLNFGFIEKFDENAVVAKEYQSYIKWFNSLTKKQQKEYREKKLSSQFDKKDALYSEYDSIGLRRNVKKRSEKKRTVFPIQLAILILMFFTSIMLMFIEHPAEAIKNSINGYTMDNDSGSSDLSDGSQFKHVKVDQKGLINERNGSIYSDVDLENKIIELPFAAQIYIEEKIDESVYKVKVENGYGYMDSTKAELFDTEEVLRSNYTVADFLPLFPETFLDSYGFLFNFLNTDYEEVKNSVQGLTEESEDQFGQSTLVYETEKMSYIFNKDNTSNAIEIREVNIDDSFINNFIMQSSLVSEDKQLYLLFTNDYKVYLDTKNKSIIFKSLE